MSFQSRVFAGFVCSIFWILPKDESGGGGCPVPTAVLGGSIGGAAPDTCGLVGGLTGVCTVAGFASDAGVVI